MDGFFESSVFRPTRFSKITGRAAIREAINDILAQSDKTYLSLKEHPLKNTDPERHRAECEKFCRLVAQIAIRADRVVRALETGESNAQHEIARLDFTLAKAWGGYRASISLLDTEHFRKRTDYVL